MVDFYCKFNIDVEMNGNYKRENTYRLPSQF